MQRDRTRGRRQGSDPRSAETGPTLIYGIHAAEAALANPRRVVHAVQLTRNAQERLAPVLAARGIAAEIVAPTVIERRLAGAVHQGVLIEAEPLEAATLAEVLDADLLVVLDQVTDPHNVGAVLRSAAAFGAGAVVLTERHSPPLGGALAKAASGALDRVRVAVVGNLAQAMATLGDAGYERLGFDSEAEHAAGDHVFGPKLALVLGAEDKGLRRLTREHCDALLRLETRGEVASLNVSNAAAIALYLAARR